MQIGLAFPASTTVSEHIVLAESLGYEHAWLDDSQMLFSDPYVSLALCAERTERISLGVGVTNPRTRVAPVTANAIATVNRLAPGRVALGIGTGNTSLRAMGRRAARVAELREHVVAVRALLTGQAGTGSSQIRFLNPDGGWIDVSTPIPIYIAGSGPRVLELAGELGDGVILFGTVDEELLAAALARVRRGAERAGRDPATIPVMCMTAFCLLGDGEAAAGERALRWLGPFVSSAANLLAVSNPDPAELPDHLREDILGFRDVFRAAAVPGESPYAEYAREMRPDVTSRMTDAVVRATTLTGTAAEIRASLAAMERAGVGMVAIRPVVDVEQTIRSFADVAG